MKMSGCWGEFDELAVMSRQQIILAHRVFKLFTKCHKYSKWCSQI